ncbi:MAG: hypothetical protein LKF82_07025 [Acinetobacter populi]|jgi:hypothetical protein|uniref:hypothetical protein n=1 Tax=Acinetobacter populi TaxID=1582270 RepID=UPI002352EC0D|nr:hypothetical protein [Acinetobacter populi]MCH4247577.1 hypothetical protein [Acinetobacter populi]
MKITFKRSLAILFFTCMTSMSFANTAGMNLSQQLSVENFIQLCVSNAPKELTKAEATKFCKCEMTKGVGIQQNNTVTDKQHYEAIEKCTGKELLKKAIDAGTKQKK